MKKMIKRYKRSYNEDENDYSNIDGTAESSKERENFDDYEDGDGYDVDYKKTQTKQNKKTSKGLSSY